MHAYRRLFSRSRSQLRHRTKCVIIATEKPINIKLFFLPYVTLTRPPFAFCSCGSRGIRSRVSCTARTSRRRLERVVDCFQHFTHLFFSLLAHTYINLLHSDRHAGGYRRATRVSPYRGTVSSFSVAAHFRSRNRTETAGHGTSRQTVVATRGTLRPVFFS